MGRRARPALPTPCSSPPAPPTAAARSTTGPASPTSTTRRNAGTSPSTATSLHLDWDGKQVHLIDTPGYPDFIGNALSALAAVENVVLAVSAPSGIEVNTRRIFQEASRLGLGRIIALTKMDADNVDYPRDLERDPRDLRHRSASRSTCRSARGRRFSGRRRRHRARTTTSPPTARCTRPRPTRWSSSRSSRPTRT